MSTVIPATLQEHGLGNTSCVCVCIRELTHLGKHWPKLAHVSIPSRATSLGICVYKHILIWWSVLHTGLSMFNWCWIAVNSKLETFITLSVFMYYLPHLLTWVFSTVVLVFALIIFWGGRFAASSETRKFVMKQNVVYVLVLGLETGVIIPLWLAQLSLLNKEGQEVSQKPRFYTQTDLSLAIVFAVIHSLRGTIDLLVWWVTFSIGLKDFKEVYQRVRAFVKCNTDSVIVQQSSLHTPLIKADTAVNRALRRDAIYCINIGILDAVKLNVDQQYHERLGSVREPFVAQAMVLWDEENRQQETENRLAENPFYHEQTERKITFPPSASIQKFAFQDIEPTVFHLLRDAYGISSSEYRRSFKLRNAADVESSGMLEKFTEGKSGSFFYFSHDYRYIIKTVTLEEEKFLRKIAHRYYKHMKQNRNSLIVRFFGLHKVRLAPEQRYISVVVMENIFYNKFQLKIHSIYDLKGSTVGRRALKGGRTKATYHGTMKDLDLDESIFIGAEAKAQLTEQLEQDVGFLTRCGVMDYSLLLGIHDHAGSRLTRFESESLDFGGSRGDTIVDVNVGNGRSPSLATPPSTLDRRHHPVPSLDSSDSPTKPMDPHVPWFRQDMGGLRSHSPFHPCVCYERQLDGREASAIISDYQGVKAEQLPVATYFFGVVDILQEYNVRKKTENFLKTTFLCQNKHELSAVRQQEYGERFLKAMNRVFQ